MKGMTAFACMSDLDLDLNLEPELRALKDRIDRKEVSREELVSRGEYFSAKLMAAYLGFQFVDAADWVKFNFDGSVNQEESYKALRGRVTPGMGAVIPGFYGAMPDGTIKTFSRGGSDITGSLAAAALDADVYENWTDVSGFLVADPRIVENPRPIKTITYREFQNVPYVRNIIDREYQQLNIFAPESYYQGEGINGYTLHTAPVFMPNSVGGYMPGKLCEPGKKEWSDQEEPNTIFRALQHGCVVVAPAIRGRVLKAEDGTNAGKAGRLRAGL